MTLFLALWSVGGTGTGGLATQETWVVLNLQRICVNSGRNKKEIVAQPMLAVLMLLLVVDVYAGTVAVVLAPLVAVGGHDVMAGCR